MVMVQFLAALNPLKSKEKGVLELLMASSSGSSENEYFAVGSVVTCVTCHGERLKGEVVAFDPLTKMMALKSASTAGKTYVHIVNMDLVKDVDVEQESSQEPPPVSHINYEKIERRSVDETTRKRRLIHPPNVSQDGIHLFLAIAKTIDDVGWDNYSINILKTVVVSPPYNLDNIAIKSGSEHTQQALSTLAHVQKIAEKYYKDKRLSPVGSETAKGKTAVS